MKKNIKSYKNNEFKISAPTGNTKDSFEYTLKCMEKRLLIFQ